MTHTQTQGADGAGTKTAATAWLLKRLKAARSDSEAHPEGHSNRTFYAGQAIAYENVLSLLEDEESTPAPAATPGVPDSLRALLDRVRDVLWREGPTTSDMAAQADAIIREMGIDADIEAERSTGKGTLPSTETMVATARIARIERQMREHGGVDSDDLEWMAKGIRAAIKAGAAVQSLIAAQPAGQSIGQFGTETIPDWLVEFVRSSAHTARFHALPHTEHWKTVERAAVWAASLQARRAEMLRTASECDDAEPGSGAYRRGVAQGIEEALADHPAPPEAQ